MELMKTVAAAVVAVLVGCAGAEPRLGTPEPELALAAIERWQGGGDVGECERQARAGLVSVLRVSALEIHDYCPDSAGQAFLLGCMIPADDGASIVVAETESRLDHELRHWLALCALGDGDADHNDSRVGW